MPSKSQPGHWAVKVLGKTSKAVSVQFKTNISPGKTNSRCRGYSIGDSSNNKKCTTADSVKLQASNKKWQFVSVPGTDCFNIIDTSAPKCTRYLSASSSCSSTAVHLARDSKSRLQQWRLVKSTSHTTPKPTPTPKPQKPPTANSPLMLAVAATSPYSGSVMFQPSAKAKYCNVILENAGKLASKKLTMLSYPQTVYFPANLIPKTSYSVRVVCKLRDNTLRSTLTRTLQTPPSNVAMPYSMDFAPTSNTSATITVINQQAGCTPTSYEATATPKDGNGQSLSFTSTTPTIQLNGLTPGKDYQVATTAVCANGTTTQASTPSLVVPPMIFK